MQDITGMSCIDEKRKKDYAVSMRRRKLVDVWNPKGMRLNCTDKHFSVFVRDRWLYSSRGILV
jgi:hypothetical protein